jgi:hypothetical protein
MMETAERDLETMIKDVASVMTLECQSLLETLMRIRRTYLSVSFPLKFMAFEEVSLDTR